MSEKYPLALPAGTVLAGQYIVEKVLGQGGFGITYEAKDHKTNERVAVKEFFPDSMATRTDQTAVLPFSGEKGDSYAYGKTCFLQEAETLAKFIGNENIVRIHSYFEENGTAYFVMDFVEGISFDQYLKQHGGRVPYKEAEKILCPVMDALSAVHSKGIIHRDVTPDNIYITKEGVVKLLDFGAARYSLGDQSRSLDVILKHGFAPKEQYTRRGKQGPYTDIYALGATFYFALTGKRPPDSVERLDEDDLIPPSSLGVQLSGTAEDAILKALSVQPADRFQSMAAFKNALLDPQQAAAVQPPPAPAQSRPAVVQTFFHAPETANAPDLGAEASPSAGESAAAAAVKSPPAKPAPRKKLIFISAAAAAVVLVAMGLWLGLGRSGREAAGKPDGGGEGQTAPPAQESALPAFSVTPEPSPAWPSFAPEASPSPQPTNTLSGNWKVLGNSAENIMNGGLALRANGRSYYVKDSGRSLWTSEGETYIYQNADGIFSNLIDVDGTLYFLYAGSALSYDPQTGQDSAVPELASFNNITRLLLTEDFYVICCTNDNGTASVYRVSRADGEAVRCCDTDAPNCFTLSDDGWIYYIVQYEDHTSNAIRMRLDTLEQEELVYLPNQDLKYCNPIVAGDYLYLCYYNTVTLDTYKIVRIDLETGFQEDTCPTWDISAKLNTAITDGGIGMNVHYQNHIIYFYIFTAEDGSGELPILYQITGRDDGTFDIKEISRNSCLPNLSFFDDGRYYVRYFHREEGDSDFQPYYRLFDANGDQIQED